MSILDFIISPNRNPRPDAERRMILNAPTFGQTFTDNMVTLRWDEGRGWHSGQLAEFRSITLPPSASIFHYGQGVFEGMKAYMQPCGSVALFRPERNAARFNASARRLAMPELPTETFVQAVKLLVRQDRGWVPEGEGNNLYLRPFMVATQPTLGFTLPSTSYLFCVIASPAPGYFSARTGPSALTVWLSEEYSRAAPGGTGFAKAGGNYAAAFLAQRQAAGHGCDQVVWLDAVEHTWVEEMGGMNLFFVQRTNNCQTLMTPALTGTLLPGVTRDSLLRLASRLGLRCEESRISVEQWRKQCATGQITEVFACGTAAVIAPVGEVRGAGGGWVVSDGLPGPVTMRLRSELLGIQHGRVLDEFGWMHIV